MVLGDAPLLRKIRLPPKGSELPEPVFGRMEALTLSRQWQGTAQKPAKRNGVMIEVLSKPADQIDIHDIHRLIELEVPEGEQIEFKDEVVPENWTGC